MPDIAEVISTVDFVDEARDIEQIKNDLNEDNKDRKISLVSTSCERWIETVPVYSGRRHSANTETEGWITAYATQRIHDIVSSFKCIFDQSLLHVIIAETNRKGRGAKENE